MRLDLASILLVSALASPDSVEWKHLYCRDGFDLYRATTAAIPTYKAEGTVPVALFDLMAVVADLPRRTEWIADLAEVRVLEGDVMSRVVLYERYDMPWPLRDRDSVVESTIHIDRAAGVVTVDYRGVSSPVVPVPDGTVRIPVVQGQMRFAWQGAQTTEARYEATLDVGGRIPEWLVKVAIRDVPAYTLKQAVEQVERTRGQYDDFVAEQRALDPRGR